MPSWLWILIVVAVVVVLLQLFARRTVIGRVDPTQVSLSPELVAQVRQLAVSGQQIPAIKLLCQSTGMGLAAAKTMVDRMTAGGQH